MMDIYDFRGAYKPTGGRVGVRTGGAGRKRCTKGKSCGATCISAAKECWVDLGGKPGTNGGRNLHDATSQVRDLVKGKTGTGGSVTGQATPQSTPQPKPQPTPQTKPQSSQQSQPQPQLTSTQIKKREQLEANGEAQKIMNKRQDAANLDFAGPQAKAIRTYTSDRDIRGVNQYQNVNNCLRNPSACKNEAEAKSLQKDLDKALAALPKNTDNFQFTRVIPATRETAQLYDFLKNAKPGTILKDPGYGSFTSDKTHASGLADPRFGNTIKLVTRSGQIVPVNQYSNIKDEAEGILPRGSSLKIARVVEDQNGLTVFLED